MYRSATTSGGCGTSTQHDRRRPFFTRGRLSEPVGPGNVARKDVSLRGSGCGWRAVWRRRWRRHFSICHSHLVTCWLMARSLPGVF